MLRTARERPILLVTRIHMPEASAASFRLQAVERALVSAGARVEVLTTTVPGVEAADEAGVSISRWPALRDASGYLRGYLPYMSFDLPAFFRILAAARPRVALVEPPPTTGVVARCAFALKRVPYVWYAPDVWSDATDATEAPAPVKKAVRAMESFAMRGARCVIAINEDVAARARTLGARRVRVVPNGIDTSAFALDGGVPCQEEREVLGVGEEYFVYAGTASEWQGAEVFVEALSTLRRTRPEAQLLFLGQGSAWPGLKKAASGIPAGPSGRAAVVFLPSLPSDEAAAWQRGALACLVSIKPGIGYDFAYPTKVLAALSCGTPVIYSGVGPAVADIRANRLGWALPHEAREVESAMREACAAKRDEAERRRLHEWIETHRSISKTGRDAARVVLGSAR